MFGGRKKRFAERQAAMPSCKVCKKQMLYDEPPEPASISFLYYEYDSLSPVGEHHPDYGMCLGCSKRLDSKKAQDKVRLKRQQELAALASSNVIQSQQFRDGGMTERDIAMRAMKIADEIMRLAND